jgi:hypothetical protein
MYREALLILIASALLGGCFTGRHQGEFDLTQLLGHWTIADSLEAQSEEWSQVNDSTFVGKGYVIEGGDTTFFETLEIRKTRGAWRYMAGVANENGGEVVEFTLRRQNENRIEFENENHDFPKRIGYELIEDNQLQAYIEGPRDGQNIRVMFNFVKAR